MRSDPVRSEGAEHDVERTVTLPRISMPASGLPPTDLPPINMEPHESWLPAEHPLYRPRHGTRQRTALVCALVFFCVPALALALGVRAVPFENRPLASLPGLSSGWGLFTDLPQWATDNLPWRNSAVVAADALSRGVFGEPWPPAGDHSAAAEPPFAAQSDPPPTPAAGQGKVIEGKQGWLYYGFDAEGKCSPARSSDEVIGNLARLRRAVESSGRRFVLVVAPDKSTAVPDYLPDSYPGRNCAEAASEDFWRRAPAETGAVDLRADLRTIQEHDGTAAYYPLDSHWDDRGALLMVRHVAERLAPAVSAGWKVAPERTEVFESDLPKLIGRNGLNVVQVFSLAPDGIRDRTQPVVADLRTAWRIQSTPTTGMVSGRVGFLVDSFAMAATRYLPAVFSDAKVLHSSTLSTNTPHALQMMVEQETIVVECVERDLISGVAAVLDPKVIDQIGGALGAAPLR